MEIKIKDKNLYYVGGVVRDEILGLSSCDIDLCYEGDAIEFSKNYPIIKTNPEFGTVRIKSENEYIDIASTRTEKYPRPGHLPVVDEIGCSLEKDLKRRDFTINALAKSTVSGEIIDFFNGLEDIKNKKIRVLHDNSFIDDPTRILRALKFSIRFGFQLDDYTQKLQEEYLKNINYDMCYHRIKKELKETFNLNKYDAFKKFQEQNIYKILTASNYTMNIDTRIEELVNKYKPKSIWLVYLGNYDLEKLELTCDEKNIINKFNIIKKEKPLTDYEQYRIFNKSPLESILLYAVNIDYNIAINYLEKVNKIKSPITGKDLIENGFNQNKELGEVLEFSNEIIIKSPCTSKEELMNLIKDKFKC